MAKKLFHAEVTYHYYFLAEEGEEYAEAENYMRDVIDDDGSVSPDVNEVTSMADMLEWDDHDCLVYGEHDGDITLREAFEISTGKTYEQADEEFKAKFSK